MFNAIAAPGFGKHTWSSCSDGDLGQSMFDTANSWHPRGILAVFGDGSVHFVKDTIARDSVVVPGHAGRGRGAQLRQLLRRPGPGVRPPAPRAMEGLWALTDLADRGLCARPGRS